MSEGASRPGRIGLDATMDDVAAMAGVTKMTVSRVLRHPERVLPETRERVARAIVEVGYIPNRVAGGLTAGRSGLVAAIVPTLRHSLFAETLEGAAAVFETAGIGVIIASSGYRPETEEAQIRAVLERRPDGVILTGLTHTPEARDLLRRTGIPIVETWESGDAPLDMAVGFSNREAARHMVLALVRAGYREIAFVNGPGDTNERARHRAEGYAAAIRVAGLRARPVHVARDDGAILPETGAAALDALIAHDPAIDAVFFTSDVYAVGAILRARALGIAVPSDLGIAGFHDLEMGRIVTPTLTTVHVPALEMGRHAAELILARLGGEGAKPPPKDLPFAIVERESTRRRG